MRPRIFRTKYLTGSHIQIKYLSLLLISMVVPMVFVCGCLYYFIFTLMGEQIGIPEYVSYHLTPVLHKINIMLMIGLPPLFLLLLIWGIILSHRFAGPLERLERELKEVTGDKRHGHRIVFRKHDDIKPIADSINNLLNMLDERKK